MTTLEQALADPGAAGLYRLPARVSMARVELAATGAERALYTLDGAGIADKASFLRACAAALDFPAYFGRNWDALQDCLTDLAWTPPQARVILFAHAGSFMRQAPADWQTALAVLTFAADYWRATPTPLWVLLRDTGRAPASIPALRA